MADPENEFPIETTMSLTTDWVRAIIGGISSRISPTNFATVIASLLTTNNSNTVRTETTNTSLVATDDVLLMDCTSGDRAVLLMDASDVFSGGVGQSFKIKRIDKTAGTDCQVNTTGGQLIDGDANWILTGSATELNWIEIQSIGTAWHIVG